jgi:hypothetical protein
MQLSRPFWVLVNLVFILSSPGKTDTLLALMIGFNNTGQKGVLLFGELRSMQLMTTSNGNVISSIIPHRHVRKYIIYHLRVQCQ